MTDRDDKAAVAALSQLAKHNIPPDVQELLVYGNPQRGVPPGALSMAMRAALDAYLSNGAADDSGLPALDQEP